MKKTLKYYLSLEYPIVVTPIAKENGGGYEASIPQLGRYTFVGDGSTIEEAIKNLNETKRSYFKKFYGEEKPIPEPEIATDDYSGRILLRIPSYLHGALAEQANRNGISLNQHISNLLAFGIPIHELKQTIREMCDLWNAAVHSYEISRLTPTGELVVVPELASQLKAA